MAIVPDRAAPAPAVRGREAHIAARRHQLAAALVEYRAYIAKPDRDETVAGWLITTSAEIRARLKAKRRVLRAIRWHRLEKATA